MMQPLLHTPDYCNDVSLNSVLKTPLRYGPPFHTLCYRHFRFKSWYVPAIQTQTAAPIYSFNVRFGSSDLNQLSMRFSLLKN